MDIVFWFLLASVLLGMSITWGLGNRAKLRALERKHMVRTMVEAGGSKVYLLSTDGGKRWFVLNPDFFPNEHRIMGTVERYCPELVSQLHQIQSPAATTNLYAVANGDRGYSFHRAHGVIAE